MKIAFIIPSLANRGPIVFTLYLLEELRKYNIVIEVFYFKDSNSSCLTLPVKCTKIPFFRRYDFSDFDIVHTTMALPDIFAFLFVDRNKWISSMHNFLEKDVKMLYSPHKSAAIIFLWKIALKRCKNIIVSSTQMQTYYEQLLKNKNTKYRIIPYGICEKEYNEIGKADFEVIQKFKTNNFTVIGSAGLFVARKGFDQLFSLLNYDKTLALILIGDGMERKNLEASVKKFHLQDRVFMPGFRNSSYNYYKYFDIYAHVSYSEGFGLAMLEAMSKKLPIICSDLEIYRDYFSEKDMCFFKAGNEASLKNAYSKIISNLNYYGQSSYDLFLSHFDVKVMTKNHLDFYEDIISASSLQSEATMYSRKKYDTLEEARP